MSGGAIAIEGAALADPVAFPTPERGWVRAVGPLLSILVLAVAVHYGLHQRFSVELRELPLDPTFFALFLLAYCATPAVEWLIYRRLWSIPASGFLALVRKQIGNELLFDYLGEVHFYAWARQHVAMKAAPFGAIKDNAIVSAICGSAVTLAMLPFVAFLVRSLSLGLSHRMLAVSSALMLASLLVPFLLRPRLFALPRADLWFIARMHMLRISAITVFSACLWHLVLPDIQPGWWFLLAAVRQSFSRLPLVPNKDVLFVGVAVLFLGQETRITALLVMLASLTLLLHLLLGTALACGELLAARGVSSRMNSSDGSEIPKTRDRQPC